MVLHGGERHQFLLFFLKAVMPAVRSVFQVFMVQLIQAVPQILVKGFKTEVLPLFEIMEKSFFQYAHGILHGTLVFRLFYFGRQDYGLVMLRPFRIVLVQIRIDPVFVCDDGLFTVIADEKRRDAFKELQHTVVRLDPFRLFCGEHAFRKDVLRIRQDRHKYNNGIDLTCKPIGHLKGLSCKVNLDLLANHRVLMQRFRIVLAPSLEKFAELTV